MTDQCKHCQIRGDLDLCLKAECFQHENWYAKEQQKQIDKLNKVVEAAKLVSKYKSGRLIKIPVEYSELLLNLDEALAELKR